jgi:DNA-binding NtrC family response regulator
MHNDDVSSGARRTVLVVDDDERLGTLVAEMVRAAGYNALKAIGSEQALQLFQAAGEKVDIVISDFLMPGMNGAELIQRLRARNPKLPVIVMTGYGPALSEYENVLEKPFTLRQLERRLAESAAHSEPV